MKKIVILLTILTYNLASAQVSTSIQVQDTRNTNDAPNFFTHGLRADFKTRATIGVPGTGTYSANLTIAPWSNTDNSGGKNHQLNFNEDGIFYRNANPLDAQWGTWRQFLVTDVNGNAGIGTSAPQYKLDVRGASFSTEHTIQSYSPLLILKRDTNLGGFIQGIQTKALDGTDNWFFGNNQADTWIVSKGDFSHPKLTILDNGSVGIGAVDWQYLLNVNGKSSFNGNMRVNAKIEAKEIKVVNTPTADFVFAEDYALPSLESVEKHIKEKKHLPEIASAKEMEKEGVNVGEFQIKLLQKIEELTLYTIEQNKKIAQLQNELKALSNKVNQ